MSHNHYKYGSGPCKCPRKDYLSDYRAMEVRYFTNWAYSFKCFVTECYVITMLPENVCVPFQIKPNVNDFLEI
jgi:hypothetical protein